MNDSGEAIEIRRAAAADAAGITALTEAAYSNYIGLIGRLPQPMMADYDQMVAEHPVWVLLVEGELAGVLVLMREPAAMLIYSVAISPEYQRRGLGQRLLAWAEQQAREEGYGTIRLYTNARYEYNIGLYQWLGYVETGRELLLNSMVVNMAKKL